MSYQRRDIRSQHRDVTESQDFIFPQRCDVEIQRCDVIERKLKFFFLINTFLSLRASLFFLGSDHCPTPVLVTRATSLSPLRSRSLSTEQHT